MAGNKQHDEDAAAEGWPFPPLRVGYPRDKPCLCPVSLTTLNKPRDPAENPFQAQQHDGYHPQVTEPPQGEVILPGNRSVSVGQF